MEGNSVQVTFICYSISVSQTKAQVVIKSTLHSLPNDLLCYSLLNTVIQHQQGSRGCQQGSRGSQTVSGASQEPLEAARGDRTLPPPAPKAPFCKTSTLEGRAGVHGTLFVAHWHCLGPVGTSALVILLSS